MMLASDVCQFRQAFKVLEDYPLQVSVLYT